MIDAKVREELRKELTLMLPGYLHMAKDFALMLRDVHDENVLRENLLVAKVSVQDYCTIFSRINERVEYSSEKIFLEGVINSMKHFMENHELMSKEKVIESFDDMYTKYSRLCKYLD